MDEYIKREAVKEAIGFTRLNCVAYGENKSLLDVINEIPAADAIEQLVKERDAAVKDLRTVCQHYNIANICETCKRQDMHCRVCEWEWRGLQE